MRTHYPGDSLPGNAITASLAVLAAAALFAAAPAPADAQGWIDPIDPAARTADAAVVRLRTDVTVRVSGRVAEIEVEEWFENRGRRVAEGDYLYPLPGGAVFSSFSLYQDDRELRGETMDAERARAIYEEIVRSMRDPALIELVGHGLVRARVFPIEPGQRRRITLRYSQLLPRAGDALQLRYVAGGAHRGVNRAGATAAADAPLRFTLTADADAFGRPFSPTHPLRVERTGGELRVTPGAELSGEFAVFLPLARPVVGLTLATHRPSSGAGYFMLTLSPGMVRQAATPRDLTVVVDVSGSMAGQKLEQTRQALHQILGSLSRQDRFRLVSFSSAVATSADGWARPLGDELRDARRWVDGLRAQGGTNIAGALDEAFRLTSPPDRLPMVVFLTDGLATVGERDPERIAAMAEASRGRARVFAFGVGYDVNTYLLDRLSAAARGSTAYVQPGEDVELAVGTLAARISHPVLTDLEIRRSPVRLTEIHPVSLPDLFADEELVLFGRYEGPGDGPLELRGRRAGRGETFAIAGAFPDRETANDYIPRLWAARKLGELTRQLRLHGHDDELVEEIRRTALRYGLLSEYTSHLVLEPGVLAHGEGRGARTPAPAMATGAAAVRSAESARMRREASSTASLDMAEIAMEQIVVTGGPRGGADRRVVAGRAFELRDGTWHQVGAAADQREVAIRSYSPAYFALLRAAPELRAIVSALDHVRVAGASVTLRFGDDGRDTLSPAAAERLAAEFRGR